MEPYLPQGCDLAMEDSSSGSAPCIPQDAETIAVDRNHPPARKAEEHAWWSVATVGAVFAKNVR